MSPSGVQGLAPADRGAADALGLVLIAPAVLGLALLVISLGRGVDATAQVRTAAEAAAQAAALERTPEGAQAAAQRVVDEMLGDTASCRRPGVSRPEYPGGAVPKVRITVTCEVSNQGIEVISPAYDEAVTAVATLDEFRAAP